MSFEPTHLISLDSGLEIPVMLCEGCNISGRESGAGPAYTGSEYLNEASADFERQESGDWTFQGEPFAGAVEEIDESLIVDAGRLAKKVLDSDDEIDWSEAGYDSALDAARVLVGDGHGIAGELAAVLVAEALDQ